MMQVILLKIPVSDLTRSVTFYERALGLSASFVAEEFGWAQLEGLSLPLALYVPGKGGGERTIGGSLDFHLACGDLKALREKLPDSARGVGLHENADGSVTLEFQDPDGNEIKVFEAPQDG